MARPIIKPLPESAPDMYAFINDAANDEKPAPSVTAAPVRQVNLDPALVAHIKPTREYPLFYHCRGGESDIKFVLSRMRWIPKSLRHAVSIEYERIYDYGENRDSRKNANTFLHEQANKYRNK